MVQFVSTGPSYNDYCTVAASQTNAALTTGGGGSSGDFLARLVINSSGTTSTLVLKDGSTTLFTTGVLPLGLTFLDIQAYSQSGKWNVTTGAGTTIMAIGEFT